MLTSIMSIMSSILSYVIAKQHSSDVLPIECELILILDSTIDSDKINNSNDPGTDTENMKIDGSFDNFDGFGGFFLHRNLW